MLEVGAPAPWIPTQCPGTPRLSWEEAQAHFAAWCVTSSPLVLGLDLANMTEYDTWWPVVSNTEAIAVNQAWAGEAGRMLAVSDESTAFNVPAGRVCEEYRNLTLPNWTAWAKALPGNKTAALALNTLDTGGAAFSISVAQLGFPIGSSLSVRDLNTHTDLPHVPSGGGWDVSLLPRGSAFLLFSLAQ